MNKGIEVYPTYILKRLDYLGLKGILVIEEKKKYLVLKMVSAQSTHSYSVIESCSNANAYSMCNLMYKQESYVSIYRTLFLGKIVMNILPIQVRRWKFKNDI